MRRCRDCKYWEPSPDNPGFGKCSNTKFRYWRYRVTPELPRDGVIYWDAEGDYAAFLVGEDFCCTHFTPVQRCQDCKFWQPDPDFPDLGRCIRSFCCYCLHLSRKLPADVVIHVGYEDAELLTGKDFGCIHFMPKDPA